MGKINTRSLSPSAQEHLRRLAGKAVMEGNEQIEVVQMLGVTPHTVCHWVKAYRLQRQDALKAKKKRCPAGGKLLP